ncbi:MAG: HAD family phosphatase [Muribaculaceae bacterium]|nr:HAD family phosphatase [Muribaculaceae bacterium]MDE6134544.1 HAD family phosphatase [Muribaculaceae bacterium]
MIRNLLFDLGGVIMDIERLNCVKAFQALGLKNAESFFGDYAQTGIFMALEDGSASVEEFHAALRAALPDGISDYQIDNALNRFLTGIPVERLQALRNLRRRGFGIYLLSNTNPIMWNSRIASEFAKEGLRREDYFDGMVTSFEAKCAKPDSRIFEYTVEKLGIEPAETLFFDDSKANTDAAAALGFATAHVLPGTEFTDYLPE